MAFRGSASIAGSGTTQTVTVTGIGIQLGDIVLLCLCDFFGNTPTFPSGFAQVTGTSPAVNDGNAVLLVYYKVATSTEVAASTLAVTGVSFGGALTCRVYSGRNTTTPFAATFSQTNNTTSNAFPVTFSITGMTANAGDDVVVFVGQDIGSGTTAATLSYAPSSGWANGAVANDTVDTNAEWIASSDIVNASAGATGTIAGVLSVTSGAGPGQTRYLAQVISIASGVQIYDGTTASGTSVSTGTGGTALPAFNVGDCIHVLCMAQTASALTETFPGDGHNTYTHLQIADNHSTTGFIFSRYMTIVTTAIGSPVITDTWSGTAKLAIAVAKLSNINTGAPNVVGGNAQHQQTAPSGSNAQTSGPTTSPNLLVPVTLGAWGFSVSETGAPTAGSGFTQIGTAWAALGAACLTYETATSMSSLQQVATFTPVGGSDTYTFLDVFNQIGSAPPTVPPSGPMPRQIYIMP